jgi:hypothetical protein
MEGILETGSIKRSKEEGRIKARKFPKSVQ